MLELYWCTAGAEVRQLNDMPPTPVQCWQRIEPGYLQRHSDAGAIWSVVLN